MILTRRGGGVIEAVPIHHGTHRGIARQAISTAAMQVKAAITNTHPS
jgi:hypothetical protein